jgi:formate hydrogenlyase subunit 4
MIHEAMVLEYSGPSLALIELAAHIKQLLFITIAVNILLPINLFSVISHCAPLAGLSIFFVKVLIAGTIVAVLEVSIAKLRLFRAIDFLLFGFLLSATAFILAVSGM